MSAPDRPAGDLAAPRVQRFAPDRVGRHDVARAKRKAGGIQRARDALGKGGEPAVHGVVPLVGVGSEHQAVVLVGVQEALAAAAGPHDKEGERHRCRPPAVRLLCRLGLAHDAAHQGVVDRRKAGLQRHRILAVAQQVRGKGGPAGSTAGIGRDDRPRERRQGVRRPQQPNRTP